MEALRILVVEDDDEMLQRVVRSLADRLGDGVALSEEIEFDRALSRLAAERFDLVVLDVRKGDPGAPLGDGGLEAGRKCFEAVRAARFIPVVFHTGLPGAVRDLESGVVTVVEKGGPPAALADVVEGIVKSGLPGLVRAVVSHVERVHRDYMWEFGARAWQTYGRDRPHELVHLLARRLALSFEEAEIDDLLTAMAGLPAGGGADGLNPVRLYIMPPIGEGAHRTGDIYEGAGDMAGYWVLLTPTCDLVSTEERPRKVSNPVLARCSPLTTTDEHNAWRQEATKAKFKALTHLVENNRDKQPDRYFFLPGAFELPDLVVDLAAVQTVPVDNLDGEHGMRRVASLDTPFAASMLTRFLRYFGRFGTADLDVGYVLRRLSEA